MLVKQGQFAEGDTVDIVAGDWAGATGRVVYLYGTPHARVNVNSLTGEDGAWVRVALSALRHHAWPLSGREVESIAQGG